jgi:two-component system, NtrC family, nitrogen regulation response regulator NtrX
VFREDLFFRLNVIPIPLPPLRERPGDIPELVQHFVALFRMRSGMPAARWSEEAIQAMLQYRWPGNVRELANIVERLSILHGGGGIGVDEVRGVIPVKEAAAAPHRPQQFPDPSALDQSLSDTLDEYERLLISRAVSVAAGNIAEAARRLKTDRPNLYRRMKRLGIPVGGE